MTDQRPTGEDHLMRGLLEDAVSDVEPRPALQDIQNRTKVTPMNHQRPWLYAAVGAVAATAATLAAVTVSSDDPREASSPAGGETTEPAPSPSPTEAAGEPTATGEPSATSEPSEPSTASPPAAGGEVLAVPVYYVSDTSTGPRLFREFHRLRTDSPAKAAMAEAVTQSALDPDYHSPWAALGTGVNGVDRSGEVITVDLAGNLHDRPAGLTPEQAGIAVEQLIHTAQAAFQERAPVQLLLDGDRTDTVLGVPTSEPLAQGDPMQVQGTVWVTSPQHGDQTGSTFAVEGRGAFFEANVSWQLLRGSTVVKDGFATAQECCTLSPYRFTVRNVPDGDYELRVYDADMSDGEGSGEAEDTKQITIG